jgi:hypothetical protein
MVDLVLKFFPAILCFLIHTFQTFFLCGRYATVYGSRLSRGTAKLGGCVYRPSSSSALSINGTVAPGAWNEAFLADCRATVAGGGAYFTGGKAISLGDVVVHNNEAPLGGGIFVTGDSVVTLAKTTVRDNTATEEGGGLHVEASTLTVSSGACFVNNTARDGGGINAAMSTVVIRESRFSRCTAARGAAVRALISRELAQSGSLDLVDSTVEDCVGKDSGAVHTSSVDLKITGSMFQGCRAGVSGGAVRADGVGKITVSNGIFKANDAESAGGAFAAFGGTLNVSNSRFEDNKAGQNGGALALEATSSATLSGVTMTLNSAADAGGAVAVLGSGSMTDTGGDGQVECGRNHSA